MRYAFEIWDKTNATKLDIIPPGEIISAQLTHALEGEHNIVLSLDFFSDVWDNIVEKRYLRIRDLYDDSTKSFIIQNIDKNRETGIITCEHMTFALLDKVVPIWKLYVDITCSAIMDVIVDGTGFTKGTVNPPSSNLQTIELRFPTVLEALRLVTESWFYTDTGVNKKYFFRVNEDKSIDILTEANIGTAYNWYVHFRKNMQSLLKNSDAQQLINRMYGVGADGLTLEKANLVDCIYEATTGTATSSTNSSLTDTTKSRTVNIDDGMHILCDPAGGPPEEKEIASNTSDTWTIVGVWTNNPQVGNLYRIAYLFSTGNDMTYVLNNAGAETMKVAPGSQIIIDWKTFVDSWGAAGAGAYIDMFTKVELLKSDDSVLATVFEIDRINYNDATKIFTHVIDIGDLSEVAKIKFTYVKYIKSWVGANPVCGLQVARLRYTLAYNSKYIDDATSQASYGVVQGKYENPNIIECHNLIRTPDLSGTYTAGLCANWTAYGLCGVAENTTADYIRHGTKSQKIQTTAPANITEQGIQQDIFIEPDTNYSAYINLYVVTGTIRVTLTDSTNETIAYTSGQGWLQILIEAFSFSVSDITIKIGCEAQSGGASGEWYVDAVQVALGAQVKPFTNGHSATQLYDETYNALQHTKNPRTTYRLSLVDLYSLSPGEFDEDYEVGDSIRVVDEELNLDDQLQVMMKTVNLLKPEECQVELSNQSRSLADQVSVLSVSSVVGKRKLQQWK